MNFNLRARQILLENFFYLKKIQYNVIQDFEIIKAFR